MHPAEHHVRATKKRQKDWVEGRARGGRLDRPGKKPSDVASAWEHVRRAYGGATEAPGSSQTTADEYPGPENKHERLGR